MTEREEQVIIVLNTLYNNPLLSDIHRQALEVGIKAIKALSSSEKPDKWIPLKTRPMTEEEKEHYKTHPEYRDECRIFNCKLPNDGQEVLISVYGGVEVDTFVQDADDGCYFEGRDIYDVDAWMPLPLPYKQEVEG